MNIGVVLLAAGGSTRLGSPKQLLIHQGKTLLRRAAEAALATGCRPVVIVLSSGTDALRTELAGLDVTVVDNANWSCGMGTSLRLGVTALGDGAEAALLTLCDQPLVTAEKLGALLSVFREAPAGSIAAAAYGGTVGVPVVFPRDDFDELRALPDDAGAKPLLRRHTARVVPVPMPEALTDIDTREQYDRLSDSRL